MEVLERAVSEMMHQAPALLSVRIKVPGTVASRMGLDHLGVVDRKKLSSQAVVILVGRSSEELCQVELLVKEPASSPGGIAVGAEDPKDGLLETDFAAVPCNQ
jgi:hypothetical protein